MTSGDLNIDLTRKCFFVKVVDLWQNYPTPFAACRFEAWFSRYDGGPNRHPLPPPAQNRTFQSPPGIGLKITWFFLIFARTWPQFDLNSPWHKVNYNLKFMGRCQIDTRESTEHLVALRAAVFFIFKKNHRGPNSPPPTGRGLREVKEGSAVVIWS